MSIKYALFENHLTTDPNDYAAQVQITDSVELDALAQRVIDQGSTVTKADVLAVLEDVIKATEGYLLDGVRVNFGGLCDLYPRLRGVFNGITDTYDPARHQIDVGASPGIRVRSAVRSGASIQKVEALKKLPALLEYFDLASGEINATVTPGTIGTINGHRLKFDAGAADEGVFFIAADGSAAEFKATAVQKNKPGQLVFLVPTLGASPDYTLEVRARFGSDLRTGRLSATLTT